MSNYCRTCGKFIYCLSTQNLFEQPERIMLHQIEALTGLCLLQHLDMPAHICGPCEVALREAIGFRERIIRTQQLLQSSASVEDALKQIDLAELMTMSPTAPEHDDIVVEEEEEAEAEEEEEEHTDEAVVEYVYDDYSEPEVKEEPAELSSAELDYQEAASEEEEEYVTNESNRSEDLDEPTEPAELTKGQQTRKSKRSSTIYASVSFADNSGQQAPRTNWSKLSEEEVVALKRERRKRDCICEQCGKHFACPSNFKVHLLRHTGVKNYACKMCSLKFYTAHLLRRHEQLHRSDRPYPCQYCGQRFAHYSGRIQHERNRHTNFKPYKCSECDKAFAMSGKLKTHMLCHSGVRAFHCELCNQSFMRKSHLVAHFRSKGHKQNTEKSAVRVNMETVEPLEPS